MTANLGQTFRAPFPPMFKGGNMIGGSKKRKVSSRKKPDVVDLAGIYKKPDGKTSRLTGRGMMDNRPKPMPIAPRLMNKTRTTAAKGVRKGVMGGSVKAAPKAAPKKESFFGKVKRVAHKIHDKVKEYKILSRGAKVGHFLLDKAGHKEYAKKVQDFGKLAEQHGYGKRRKQKGGYVVAPGYGRQPFEFGPMRRGPVMPHRVHMTGAGFFDFFRKGKSEPKKRNIDYEIHKAQSAYDDPFAWPWQSKNKKKEENKKKLDGLLAERAAMQKQSGGRRRRNQRGGDFLGIGNFFRKTLPRGLKKAGDGIAYAAREAGKGIKKGAEYSWNKGIKPAGIYLYKHPLSAVSGVTGALGYIPTPFSPALKGISAATGVAGTLTGKGKKRKTTRKTTKRAPRKQTGGGNKVVAF